MNNKRMKMCRKFVKFLFTSVFVLFIIISNAESSVIRKIDPKKGSTNRHGFYDENDNVVNLYYNNLTDIIGKGDTSWFVEFYAHWCGDCIRFKPFWKTFARSIVGWRDIVTVAAIDCANPDNVPLCNDYGITNYPTVKYFSPGDKTHGIRWKERENAEQIRQGLIEILQMDQQNGKGSLWPNILPYSGSDLRDVWNEVPDAVKYLFFIFEDAMSFLGSDMILDLHKVKNLQLRRITRDSELSSKYNITNFPALLVLPRGEGPVQLNLSVPTREGAVQIIKDFMKSKGLFIESYKPEKVEDNPEKSPNDTINNEYSNLIGRPKKDVLYQLDLENALRYSLKQEIPLRKLIEGPQLQALKNFLRVISKYFPLKRGNSQFFTELYNEISNRTDITGLDFKNLVVSTEERMSPVFTEDDGWIGCAGSVPGLRGYPCGLWTLFHTLTVRHAEVFADEEPETRGVGAILNAMHGYISNFFGCSGCVQHFKKMAGEEKIFEVEGIDNTILWLWKAHNKVNLRLSGDPTEDPEAPKIQYPSRGNCEVCRNSDGTWNEPQVLNYLKKKYGFSGIIYGSNNHGD